MTGEFLEAGVGELLDAIASDRPAPAGGSVAALAVAMAAGLCAMSARRTPHAAQLAALADALRVQVAPLADADARVYAQALAARDQDDRRSALSAAADVPFEVAGAAAAVAELAAVLAEEGNPNLRGDALTAGLLAAAGARAAATLVEINLAGTGDERVARATDFADRAARRTEPVGDAEQRLVRDFPLTGDERALRAEVRDFFARELAPRSDMIERDAAWEPLREAVTVTGEAGYLAFLMPELYRGRVAKPGLVHAAIVSEEAAAVSYAFESTIATSLSCAMPIREHATAAVRSRWLDALARGSAIGAICITEPDVGSDSAGMRTRITREPDGGGFVIDGFKRYISNAGVADVHVVYGVTDPSVPAQQGMTAIVVPAGSHGLSFPRRYTLLGRRGCVLGEVALDRVRVPADHLLGEVNGGFSVMLGMFNFERILVGAAALGVARAAFAIAREHARRRVAFGQPLGCKQLIWHKIAEMSWRIDAAELLTYRAARMYDSGLRGKELVKEAAMAKLVASETAVACADAAVQILGGDGLTREHSRAEQLYRDARALPIVGGTSEMVRYLIASRDLPDLKLNL